MLLVYAILDRAPSLPSTLRGVSDEPLGTVASGELHAIAGTVSSAPPPEPTTLRAHDAAVRAICAENDAVLPARYGQAAPDARALAATLADRAGELRAALATVRGRVQMTLRVSRSADVASAPASGPSDAEGTDASAGPGARFLRARARAATLPELDPLRAELTAADLTKAERVEIGAPPGAPWHASVYHLVPRGEAARYAAVVAAAAPALAPLRVAVSGPWPCYAFAGGDLG